ncbi:MULTISPECIES: outer membrane lipid asymmetry maintenance protein MlaD [Aliivibrio]|uniref:Outer membrane lipid asymmetry maintenance protein MlaD n=2 Tax=Aliivibrio fischeri TaxID=668 RepID=A0A6N3Z395_ALIFS|nr:MULTISPECIES: outer membrane lipid asymmetry maintenance protein MlaD [Aliivibrio]ACH67230.1 toluene tolerance protein TTG2C [Aliivibrio fischeri MJ11]MBD1569243.1 outer membrane lipid asymmetry maintenance protein MlaD [Aliivibrio sp. S10_S31]MCE4937228.1 outer membrane lipid asymmetry maintenance protein MlaD [Aliivibrio fischeri]MUJ27034.1 outer membrane lipid asymmetry maintenance protein MlaD [Aliivibrio fischeri]MUK46647.1 outer membrane lipid asymmetry maintenance protein MlaD [Aliiv
MQQTRKVEFFVGLFVLAGMAALLMLLLKVADVRSGGSGEYYTLNAQFDNIGSLKSRSPVKVGGVVIGRVDNITLDKESYLPIVSMQIDKQFGAFPETSAAQILTSGLIGEQYIGIVPGFIDEDIDMLGNGDFIEDTKSALVLEDMIGQVLYSIGGDSSEASEEE